MRGVAPSEIKKMDFHELKHWGVLSLRMQQAEIDAIGGN